MPSYYIELNFSVQTTTIMQKPREARHKAIEWMAAEKAIMKILKNIENRRQSAANAGEINCWRHCWGFTHTSLSDAPQKLQVMYRKLIMIANGMRNRIERRVLLCHSPNVASRNYQMNFLCNFNRSLLSRLGKSNRPSF